MVNVSLVGAGAPDPEGQAGMIQRCAMVAGKVMPNAGLAHAHASLPLKPCLACNGRGDRDVMVLTLSFSVDDGNIVLVANNMSGGEVASSMLSLKLAWTINLPEHMLSQMQQDEPDVVFVSSSGTHLCCDLKPEVVAEALQLPEVQ